MALEVEEVLSLWREAERLLDELPEAAPDRGVVAAEVVELKRAYQRLTATDEASREVLASCHQTIDAAHEMLHAARERLGVHSGALTAH